MAEIEDKVAQANKVIEAKAEEEAKQKAVKTK